MSPTFHIPNSTLQTPFGARYYQSTHSFWLSVDPLADKYPNLSPYTYCAGNPVGYFDPDGTWIPGLDDDGNVTYTAEKGDNYNSFVRQFSCNGKGKEIFKNSGYGLEDGSIKEGQIIKGETVKKITGNEVLKGNWGNMSKSQKIAQLILAINYTKTNNVGIFDFEDFALNFETSISEQLSNVLYKTPAGDIAIRNVSIWFTSNHTKAFNAYLYSQTAGDYINKYDFRYPSPQSRRSMLLFSIDNQYAEQFERLFLR